MKYSFKFANRNCLNVYNEQGKLHTIIAIPPKEYGIDIIPFGEKMEKGYVHNFQGLVIISTELYRSVFHHGKSIATIINKKIINKENLKQFKL